MSDTVTIVDLDVLDQTISELDGLPYNVQYYALRGIYMLIESRIIFLASQDKEPSEDLQNRSKAVYGLLEKALEEFNKETL